MLTNSPIYASFLVLTSPFTWDHISILTSSVPMTFPLILTLSPAMTESAIMPKPITVWLPIMAPPVVTMECSSIIVLSGMVNVFNKSSIYV